MPTKHLKQPDAKSIRKKRHAKDRIIAVIDIGSNSVRMVVFRGLKRHLDVLFNERVLCSLGRSVGTQGRMDPESMNMAYETLARFAELCNDMKVDGIEIFATAAVRDASNGKEFVKRLEDDFGFKVKIFSGMKEAQFSAYGVLSAFPGASGVVGDLGGGSLELVWLKNGEIFEKETLSIGPVRLRGGADHAPDTYLPDIKTALSSVKWLKAAAGQPFYLVGGAWRAIARLNLLQQGWPLPVIHGYEMSATNAKRFTSMVSQQSTESLNAIPEISNRRADVIPLAALILREVMKIQKPSRIHTSANGIREGIMYGLLSKKAQAEDPLVAAAKEMADRLGRFPEHAQRLMRWLDPLFTKESETHNKLRYVACLLSDIGWQAHPEFRAENAYYAACLAPYTGITHRERAFLGITLYLVYGGSLLNPEVKGTLSLMHEVDLKQAQVLGMALRLGQRLTGGTTKPLKYSALEVKGKRLILVLPKRLKSMAGDVVLKRLSQLADLLRKNADLRLE